MGQKKLKRFAEIATFKNVLEYPTDTAGSWSAHFENNNPIVLELACGKGEYSIGLASMHPNQNFIGIDIKGNRIWVGAKKAMDQSLNNVAFIRSQIGLIENYFAKEEISEIWLPFPDPQLRAAKCKRRLTHPSFLRKYKQLLKPSGYIHLKTDSPVLYNFTKRVIELYGLELFYDSSDIREDVKQIPELLIKTHYESLDIAKSNRIHYLKFAISSELDPTKDDILLEMTKEVEKDHNEGVIDNEKEID
ncbi:MAG: tRNA ((46)-N7)-methyltransferase TrmB [Bacteroidota bacterium]|jgi:tRNA (guanine-N7-)-methyltransferase